MNEQLIKALSLLASDSTIQRQYLMDLGTFPIIDEIALEFDDAYKKFISQVDSILPNLLLKKLNKINSLLDSFSEMNDKSIWLEASLDNASWTEVREIATSILSEIQ